MFIAHSSKPVHTTSPSFRFIKTPFSSFLLLLHENPIIALYKPASHRFPHRCHRDYAVHTLVPMSFHFLTLSALSRSCTNLNVEEMWVDIKHMSVMVSQFLSMRTLT